MQKILAYDKVGEGRIMSRSSGTERGVKVMVWGFCGPIGGEIVKELSCRNFDVSEWISDQQGSKNIWDFLRGNIDPVERDVGSLISYESFHSSYFDTYHVMIARRGLYYAELHEVINEFSLAYHYFSYVLKNQKIDLVLFANIPHEGPDFVLYEVAKLNGIKTLICYQTLFDDKFLFSATIEDFGRFEKIPSLFGGDKIVLEHGHCQYLFYMKGFTDLENQGPESFFRKTLHMCRSCFARFLFFLKNPWRPLKARIKGILITNAEYNLQKSYLHQIKQYTLSKGALDSLIDSQENIVYFPLHLQPELSTSVLGGVFQDQIYAIETLSSLLGNGWVILVKENPKQTFFQRRDSFFKRLNSLNNVYLVDKTYSTYRLIEKSRFVATISGTAGWEAIKGGGKCLVFGKTWYSGLPGCYTYGGDFDLKSFLGSIEEKVLFEEFQEAFNGLMSKAGRGVVDSAYSGLVADFNIQRNAKKVVDSIVEVLRSPITIWH
jgi:hypothetical protein